jgi:1-deoxy-D-xylulose-5-phosphate synthase
VSASSLPCRATFERASLLEGIDSPSDLRQLNPGQLKELAGEIRQFVVRSVSTNGGHLGSNLGVVELTLALHRVFDSPRDLILWDTGHQAYVHKILTGRRRRFDTLRCAGGLSGYPSRSESEHDWVENSHASTILSYAHGLATALQNRGEGERRIVAVLGDGSMTGGMAYEALNNLGYGQRRVLIVLNDNGRSYAPTVGRLAAGLARVRVHPGYVKSRRRVQHTLREVPVVGGFLDRGMQGVRAALREAMGNPSGLFETLGVRYIGPVDGHDVMDLERVLRQAAEHDGPIVVHVLTQKGRGYPPAENDGEKCLHDAPTFDPRTGPPRWAPAGYTQAFADAVVAAAERDDRIVAITAAMAGPTGLRAFQRRWPDRFFDMGIAEEHAVTAAAGMAMGGLRPVVAVYSTFLSRAFDQVNLDVGLHRLPVVFCIDRAGVTGDDGPSHNGTLDLALLRQVPGMTIFAPSCGEELPLMLGEALALQGPAAIRYPKGAGPSLRCGGVGSGIRARLLRSGRDVCILAVGKLVGAAEEAAQLLEGRGVSATVWDVRVVKPLDGAMLDCALGHRLVVTAEDGVRSGGAGSSIESALTELALAQGGAVPSVVTLGLPDAYLAHGNPQELLSELGLDGPGLAASVLVTLGKQKRAGPVVSGVNRNGGVAHNQPSARRVVKLKVNGSAEATVDRLAAHTAPGVLHLAVSVQVVDGSSGHWLLQRRAATKAVFADLWANTCCTHPAPGEDPADAARRRLREETGLIIDDLVAAGSFIYRAVDPRSGLVEHEHDFVFIGTGDVGTADPDPEEISELALLPYEEALGLVQSDAGAPWAAAVLTHCSDVLNSVLPPTGAPERRSRRRSPLPSAPSAL